MPYNSTILLFYRQYKEHLVTLSFFYASINVKPEGGGGQAYAGHLTFQ